VLLGFFGARGARGEVGSGVFGLRGQPSSASVRVGQPGLCSSSVCAVWFRLYDAGNADDEANALGLSPDGSKVFVTGQSLDAQFRSAFATVAYDAATGAQLWVSRYSPYGLSSAFALAVSPDGSKVFVTGQSQGVDSRADFGTVAYDAATGTKLWESRYNGPGNSYDYPAGLGVSPDGSKVFVTGQSDGTGSADYATVAYDSTTGSQQWVSRYDNGSNDGALALGLSADGAKVFVTGTSLGSSADIATVAYNAGTGSQLWVNRYNSPGDHDDFGQRTIAVGQDRVFVTALTSNGPVTVAIDAASGAQLWVSGSGPPNARALAVSPDGSKLFATGWNDLDFVTVALDAATGAQLWASTYNGPENAQDEANALAVSADGKSLIVTGHSTDYSTFDNFATIAYSGATGTKLWARRYRGVFESGGGGGHGVAVNNDGSKVFVTGSIVRSGATRFDYLTVAYDAD
jgi:DNA-binding beta-propeller fold protein YncE